MRRVRVGMGIGCFGPDSDAGRSIPQGVSTYSSMR
jgi:hypothetical protein